MARLSGMGREIELSYSTNVHPAEDVAGLCAVLRDHVAPVSRAAFGDVPAAVNLRIGMKQAEELVRDGRPTEACAQLRAALDDGHLFATSVNGFPITDFHATRVKEQVYAPPWTDPLRAETSMRIATALANLIGKREKASVSVPTGVFKGDGDHAEVRDRCAAGLLDALVGLIKLREATGKTIVLGLEPEPYTTGETLDECLAYFEQHILPAARKTLPGKTGGSPADAESLARTFITVNLDLCHQAVEYEDPVEDLKRLHAAGIALSGLHLSAALKLPDPAAHAEAWAQLRALDEPRYLHQIVARKTGGVIERFADLPVFVDQAGARLHDYAELRCHFHVPLFVDFDGPLASTRDAVGPAARYAARHDLTDTFVAETYTWGVLTHLAASGNTAARQIVGEKGVDVNAGIARELQWARGELEGRDA